AGTGSTASTVVIQSGGTIAPGSSIGSISTGAFTLQSGGNLVAELNFSSTTNDAVFASGNVSLAGNLNMQFLGVTGPLTGSKTFVIVHTLSTNTRTGNFANIIPATSAYVQYSVNYSYTADGDGQANDVAVTFSAVPEPGSLATLSLGSLLLGRRRRARRWSRSHRR